MMKDDLNISLKRGSYWLAWLSIIFRGQITTSGQTVIEGIGIIQPNRDKGVKQRSKSLP
jgi:hypothetical protein